MSQLSRQIKKIGNYQVGDLLGRGSIGTVYKGLNSELGTIVAIKQVSLQSIRSEQLKALQQEIHLLKKLKHKYIVKYVDCIETEGFLNIILEYIESGSLASIIKKFGSFSESLVALYIKQVLEGLEYLHGQGVVHRDIKGANILITKDGIVKLADFGVATNLNDDIKSFSLVGTPYWMAPEIIEMRGHISTSCDIWSLGCTVIELLTGNPPYFDLMQYPALFRIVQDDCPPLPEGISPECRDFLIKCFHKDPVYRIDAKSLKNHQWMQKLNVTIMSRPQNQLPEEVNNTIRMHIDSQQLKPDELQQQQQSNFATIIDEGSFISVDGTSHIVSPIVQCQSPKNKNKKQIVNSNRSSQVLDSLKQLRRSAQVPLRQSQQDDAKILRDISEVVQQIQMNFSIKLLLHLKEIIFGHDKYRDYVVNTFGLTFLVRLLEEYLPRYCKQLIQIESGADNLNILKTIFEMINAMDIEQVCLYGVLPYIQSVSSSEFPKDLRVESAYFIGQLAYTNSTTLQVLLSCGALENLMDFLDPDVENNKDLIGLAIDTLNLVYESQILISEYAQNLNQQFHRNFLRLMSTKTLHLRLTLIISNTNDLPLLTKCYDILILLAKCDDKFVKLCLCETEVISKFLLFLVKYEDRILTQKIVKIFRYLANEPILQSNFEGLEIIPKCLTLLESSLGHYIQMLRNKNAEIDNSIIADLLRILFYLSKLNPQRQEEIALNNGIPLLLQLCHVFSIKQDDRENLVLMKKVAMGILCSLVQASEVSREKVWKQGGIVIYIDFLEEQIVQQGGGKSNIVHASITKLLDTILKLVEFERNSERVNTQLTSQETLDTLNACFKHSNLPTLQQIIPIFKYQILEIQHIIQSDCLVQLAVSKCDQQFK